MSVSRIQCSRCHATYDVKMHRVYIEIGCPACGTDVFNVLDAQGRRLFPLKNLIDIKTKVVDGLMSFAIVQSTDPAKKKALNRLTELRLEIQELLDIIVPEAQE